MHRSPDRREFLKTGIATAAALSVTSLKAIASPTDIAAPFRFVHLTDIHVQPELDAAEGYRQCIARINAVDPRPDFAITGGDLIMDALHVDIDRAELEFKLFAECSKEFDMSVYHTLGNHDVVGWSSRGKVSPKHPSYGKRIFAERFGEGKTYRSFDHKGWHFILVDSLGQANQTPDYIGYIDAEQIDWLTADLEKTGKTRPIVVVTHIPFISTMNQNLVGIEKAVPSYGLVTNYIPIRKLLAPYNVQIILCGHGHVRERIEVMSSTHIQSGAVCGRWWKGRLFGEPESFSVVDCDKGSFNYEYQSFDWTAHNS